MAIAIIKNKDSLTTESLTGPYKTVVYGGLTQGDIFLFNYTNDTWYVFDYDLEYYTEIDSSPEDLYNANPNSKLLNFTSLISSFMEITSISYGYSSMDNAISHYNSGITSWRNEAIAFNTWRDNTVSLMYDNIFSFTADGITLPDLAGFTGQTGYFDVGITSPSRPNLFS